MTPVERATVAVFGVLLASIFGVLLAWVFQVMEITVGTHDEGKTGTSTEKIEILRVRPLPPSAPDRFMLIVGEGPTNARGTGPTPKPGNR